MIGKSPSTKKTSQDSRTYCIKTSENKVVLPVADPGIFPRVFLKKYKLHNLIKREIYILTTTTIKKTRKYVKFTIAFYEFSYFEIVA